MKWVVCPRCGNRIGIPNKATAKHDLCPKRGAREAAPSYVEEVA